MRTGTNDYQQSLPVRNMPPFGTHSPAYPERGAVSGASSPSTVPAHYSPLPVKQAASQLSGSMRGAHTNDYQISSPPLYVHPPPSDHTDLGPGSTPGRPHIQSSNSYVPINLQTPDAKMYDQMRYD
jgi:hypothetical protein